MTFPEIYEDPSRPRTERIAALQYDYKCQEKVPIETCNLCGSDRWTILVERDRYGFPAQAAACGICGLTVLNPRMTAEAYKNFYDGTYRPLVSAYHGRRIDAETIQEEQRIYATEMEQLLASFIERKGGGLLLDVGGSTGVVAAHFVSRFGVKATILDPAPTEISAAKALGIETVTALVEEWEPGDRRFQIIGMFQTIDHLLDVTTTLGKLRTLIDDDGIFVVDIVDFRAAYLRSWSVEMAVKIDHPFSLTEETTEALLARAGFLPVKKAYSADHLHVAYVCRPCARDPSARPTPGYVNSFFREVRFVQNAPRPSGMA